MLGMFLYCSSLISLNLSNFDTLIVTDMDFMFYGCDSLNALDISNFNMINCEIYYNMFSNIDNIIYLNIFNLKNDKVISEIFNARDRFYVCQKDKILTNPNIFNCCDYNSKPDKCDKFPIKTISIKAADSPSHKTTEPEKEPERAPEDPTDIYIEPGQEPESDPGNPTEDFIEPEFDSSEDSPDIISNTSKGNSNSLSTGAIIGIIIVAVVVLVAIGTTIIYCVRRKKTKNKSTNNTNANANDNPPKVEDYSVNTLNVSIKREEILIKDEKEHKSKNNDKKIKIELSTTNQYKTKIFIDSKNTMEQLIKSYFKIIKKPELFGDKNVRFLLNGNFIPQNSQQLISEYLMGDNNLFILIDDLEERIPTSITK